MSVPHVPKRQQQETSVVPKAGGRTDGEPVPPNNLVTSGGLAISSEQTAGVDISG